MSKLDASIAFCGLYEGELLLSLMLRYWDHPRADDKELAHHLIETAAEVLNRSRSNERLIEDIKPQDMNFVAAVWYAEYSQLQDKPEGDHDLRRAWLQKVRRAVPSCFCDVDDLI